MFLFFLLPINAARLKGSKVYGGFAIIRILPKRWGPAFPKLTGCMDRNFRQINLITEEISITRRLKHYTRVYFTPVWKIGEKGAENVTQTRPLNSSFRNELRSGITTPAGVVHNKAKNLSYPQIISAYASRWWKRILVKVTCNDEGPWRRERWGCCWLHYICQYNYIISRPALSFECLIVGEFSELFNLSWHDPPTRVTYFGKFSRHIIRK